MAQRSSFTFFFDDTTLVVSSLFFVFCFLPRWQGKNKLGEALMEVRAQLREEVHEAYGLPDSVGAFPGDAGEVSMEIDGGSEEELDEGATIGEHRLRK